MLTREFMIPIKPSLNSPIEDSSTNAIRLPSPESAGLEMFRLMGILLPMVAVNLTAKICFWILGIPHPDSALIFGLAISAYLLVHSLKYYRSVEQPRFLELSRAGLITSLVVTIVLCALATAVPFLRS